MEPVDEVSASQFAVRRGSSVREIDDRHICEVAPYELIDADSADPPIDYAKIPGAHCVMGKTIPLLHLAQQGPNQKRLSLHSSPDSRFPSCVRETGFRDTISFHAPSGSDCIPASFSNRGAQPAAEDYS